MKIRATWICCPWSFFLPQVCKGEFLEFTFVLRGLHVWSGNHPFCHISPGLKYIFLVLVYGCFACMCVFVSLVCNAWRGQKAYQTFQYWSHRELQGTLSMLNWTCVFCTSMRLWSAEHPPIPPLVHFSDAQTQVEIGTCILLQWASVK